MSDFRLLMIGAMYENGGNVTHRLLDGHPQLFVYPFESQLGTRLVSDALASTFPVKYRWPVFDLDATPQADYHAIIDEECKVRARTPHVSKFRDHAFDFSDDERRTHYVAHVAATGRSRPANVEAFFRATFDSWHDRRSSGREEWYVGYSPILVVDAERILEELPGGPLPPRRPQPVVGVCRHEEAPRAAHARGVHARVDAESAPCPGRPRALPRAHARPADGGRRSRARSSSSASSSGWSGTMH